MIIGEYSEAVFLPYSVVGTPFYLMEHVSGRVYKDVSLPSLTPDQRSKVYTATYLSSFILVLTAFILFSLQCPIFHSHL